MSMHGCGWVLIQLNLQKQAVCNLAAPAPADQSISPYHPHHQPDSHPVSVSETTSQASCQGCRCPNSPFPAWLPHQVKCLPEPRIQALTIYPAYLPFPTLPVRDGWQQSRLPPFLTLSSLCTDYMVGTFPTISAHALLFICYQRPLGVPIYSPNGQIFFSAIAKSSLKEK